MYDGVFSAIFATQWHAFVVLSALLLAASEVGFRVGLRHFRRPDIKRRQGQVGTLEGGLLGLLGLLLGFTFAMAVTRYDARKQLVLDEANAIGTTWLRAALLSPKMCEDVRILLRDLRARTPGSFCAGCRRREPKDCSCPVGSRSGRIVENRNGCRASGAISNRGPLCCVSQ
jgi:hypothetical protein